jgi:ABC-type uncharacterized transport system permease subunit
MAPRPEDVEQRDWIGVAIKVLSPALSVVLAVLISSVIIRAFGRDPVAAFAALLQGSFGSMYYLGETFLSAVPLMFTGLAVAYGFRSGLFNIGAEGQLFMGGLAGAYLGVVMGGMSAFVALPTILIAGALAGAAWAFIPAVLKARVGAHEVITTMMFGYIGRYIVSWLVTGPLKAPGPIPETSLIGAGAVLPRIAAVFPALQLGRAHMGLLIAIGCAVLMWFILKYTTTGYESRAVGFNPLAAQNGGVSIASTTIKALCISGALAGLAGVVEVLGTQGRIFDTFSSGFGFTGIAVALLAKNNPLAVIPAAILFGALSAGSSLMQLQADVPIKVVEIIQALIIFFVATEPYVSKWIERRRREVTARAQ